MESEQIADSTSKKIIKNRSLSRRDLIKFVSVIAAAGSLPRIFLSPDLVDARNSESEIINGVEVYGLNVPISSQEEADDLVDKFNYSFERRLGWADKQKSVWEQREKLLPKDVRYVQFVVKRSVFESFEMRKQETGVDYVQWVKLHVDLLNRDTENAKPPVVMTTEVRRIVIVEDNFETNPIKYSKDIDAVWFSDNDTRVAQGEGTVGQGSYWSVDRDVGGNLILRNPAGASFGREFVLPQKDDEFSKIRNGVWIDCGLTHELGHLLWNVPDEYIFSFENANSLFNNFRFNTGLFMEPNLSPYLSKLVTRTKDKGIRGYYTDPRGIGRATSMLKKYEFYGVVPSSVSIEIAGATIGSLNRSRFHWPDYYDDEDSQKSCKYMTTDFNSVISGSEIKLDKNNFLPEIVGGQGMYPVLFRIDCSLDGKSKELYIPLAIFNMSKISGINIAEYKIEFSKDSYPSEYKTQTVILVDELELLDFESKNLSYAKMKIVGTSTWCVWSFQY